MTLAEAVAVVARPAHRAPIVSTRHFAARRGHSPAGRILAPWISAATSREIAISQFVADGLERPPSAVLVNGVPDAGAKWRQGSRVVLVLQRLEAEKDTLTALRAWQVSRLGAAGWSMRIVGDGSQREELKRYAAGQKIEGVVFAGRTDDVFAEFANAGMLVAPAPAEPLGLSVLEAMAAGVPVVASRAGGHLETVGAIDADLLFAPGDPEAAAMVIRRLSVDAERERASERARLTANRFSLDRHVECLLHEYELAASSGAAASQGLVTGR
jgi:glycosyltransferase involved in cell wall biosynthesis